jgi:hypothetical protein
MRFWPPEREVVMHENERGRWMNLCAQAAVERDPEQLAEMTAEITLLLKIRAISIKEGWVEKTRETDERFDIPLISRLVQ